MLSPSGFLGESLLGCCFGGDREGDTGGIFRSWNRRKALGDGGDVGCDDSSIKAFSEDDDLSLREFVLDLRACDSLDSNLLVSQVYILINKV